MSAQAGSQEAKDRMAKARAAKAKPVRARPARADTRLRERRKRTDGTIDRMAQFTLDIFEKEQLAAGLRLPLGRGYRRADADRAQGRLRSGHGR